MQVATNRRERRAQARAAAKVERRRDLTVTLQSRDLPRLDEYPAGSLAGRNRIGLSAIFCSSDPRVVERALRSARPFISSWAIVDSGSSDAVKETVHRVLDGIPGQLVHRDWTDDYAAARNAALSVTRETGAEIGLTIDADDFLEPNEFIFDGDRFRLPPLEALTRPFYAFKYFGPNTFWRTSLFRLDTPTLRWRGRAHEYLTRDGPEGTARGRFDYIGRYCWDAADRDDQASRDRRYLDLLLRDRSDEPTNPITLNHIAGTFVRLADWPHALAAIEEALAVGDTCQSRVDLLHKWRRQALANLGMTP